MTPEQQTLRGRRYQFLKEGDPWTFVATLTSEQLQTALEVGEGGYLTHWFSTDDKPRKFQIVRIHESIGHALVDRITAIETVFVGFDETVPVTIQAEQETELEE